MPHAEVTRPDVSEAGGSGGTGGGIDARERDTAPWVSRQSPFQPCAIRWGLFRRMGSTESPRKNSLRASLYSQRLVSEWLGM
eukprot:6913425-Pyramimonas_sp.AAC.1